MTSYWYQGSGLIYVSRIFLLGWIYFRKYCIMHMFGYPHSTYIFCTIKVSQGFQMIYKDWGRNRTNNSYFGKEIHFDRGYIWSNVLSGHLSAKKTPQQIAVKIRTASPLFSTLALKNWPPSSPFLLFLKLYLVVFFNWDPCMPPPLFKECEQYINKEVSPFPDPLLLVGGLCHKTFSQTKFTVGSFWNSTTKNGVSWQALRRITYIHISIMHPSSGGGPEQPEWHREKQGMLLLSYSVSVSLCKKILEDVWFVKR